MGAQGNRLRGHVGSATPPSTRPRHLRGEASRRTRIHRPGSPVTLDLETLRGVTRNRRLSPVRTTLHDWTTDAYARGAYSFVTPGVANPAAALAQPVGGVVFLAGEATSITDPTTVHGAYDTGRRAAGEALHALP
ncbi:FAD-dependent oxidoreductase [Couchioplanes azureus]|uniref:FAD-dependent oxidoreductase n=1 Tax=Couchioplanes caeruleus TaxID=56438 RepID=UPI00166FAB22|nr:FAD-dependent oxidoreductase [Couchioplanes caeruleus]GGQ84137.1 hypothetical protein GCM10010166_62990 [Couchioplanes caeruleus subsp. azureus]